MPAGQRLLMAAAGSGGVIEGGGALVITSDASSLSASNFGAVAQNFEPTETVSVQKIVAKFGDVPSTGPIRFGLSATTIGGGTSKSTVDWLGGASNYVDIPVASITANTEIEAALPDAVTLDAATSYWLVIQNQFDDEVKVLFNNVGGAMTGASYTGLRGTGTNGTTYVVNASGYYAWFELYEPTEGGGEPPELDAYATEVMADEPFAYYRLGETSGTAVADTAGNTDDGTYPGSGVTLGSSFTDAPDLKCVALNGAARILVPADYGASNPGNAFSLELWVEPTSLASGPSLLDFSNLAAKLTSDDGGSLTTHFRTDGSGTVSSGWGAPVLATDTLFHLAFTYNGSTIKRYVNGEELSSGSFSSTLAWSNSSMGNLGSSGVPSAYFTGKIGEVALYHTVLSPERVAAHYEAGLPSGFEFVGATGGQQPNNNAALNIPVVPDVEEGDTLVVFTTAENDPVQPPAGEGWTEVEREFWGDAGQRLAVFTRLVGASEPGVNYAFVNDWTVKQVGVAVAYRGSYEVHVVGTWATGGGLTGGTSEANAITTTEDAIIIAVQNQYPFTGQDPESHAATGMVRRVYQDHNGGMPSIAFLYDSDDLMPAGSYDTTITGSPSVGPCVLLLALTPA